MYEIMYRRPENIFELEADEMTKVEFLFVINSVIASIAHEF